MPFSRRLICFVTSLSAAILTTLAWSATDVSAQVRGHAPARSSPAGVVARPASRIPMARSVPSIHRAAPSGPRVRIPQAMRRLPSPSRRIIAPRLRSPSARRVQPLIQRPRIRVAPKVQQRLPLKVPRIVTPKVKTIAPHAAPRAVRPTLRKLPANLSLVSRGLKRNPGSAKPAAIAHNPRHKAGKAGWRHGHKPFFFKRGGHHWRRHYYTLPIGGLWYWYWYDMIADNEPEVLVYVEDGLPECAEDEDECSEVAAQSDILIAPAILEGRATEEMMERCAERYRSFKRETGTFVAYSGEVKVCRYLE